MPCLPQIAHKHQEVDIYGVLYSQREGVRLHRHSQRGKFSLASMRRCGDREAPL